MVCCYQMSQNVEIVSNLGPNIFRLKVRTKGPRPSICVRTFSQFTTWTVRWVCMGNTASIARSSGSRSSEDSNAASIEPIDAVLLSCYGTSYRIDGNLAGNCATVQAGSLILRMSRYLVIENSQLQQRARSTRKFDFGSPLPLRFWRFIPFVLRT